MASAIAAGIVIAAMQPPAAFAQVETVASVPVAGLNLFSVAPVGGGRFSISGAALDGNGDPACALALASGKCMFTCGEGSLRCEGGTASLPFGGFELADLATEADGTINMQIFVEGHISRTNKLYPNGVPADQAGWGAINGLCCGGSSSVLSVTIDGTNKRSVFPGCDSEPSWESWAALSPGSKSVLGTWSSEGCGRFDFNFTTGELPSGSCNIVGVTLNEAAEPVVVFSEVGCGDLP
jgi:hypothetical protein